MLGLTSHGINSDGRSQLTAVVKLRYAINFAVACEAVGYDPMPLLRKVDIDERLLKNPEHLISEHQLWKLAGEAATETGKFDIGFDAGRVSSVQDHGALEALFKQRTLYERMVTFCELAKLEYSRADFFVRPVWSGVQFGRKAIVGDREQVRQVELYVLQLMLQTIRSVLGMSWSPKNLNLQSDHHPDLDMLIRSPDSKIRFSQPETEILIERGEIAIGTQAISDSFVYSETEQTAQAAAALVQTYLFDPRLSLAFIARIFGVSERQLQRDLQKEGTNFSTIVSLIRIRTSTDLLSTSGASVYEVSKSLGYSNQAHFARAFSRATGMTPSEFRKTSQDH